MEWAFLDLRKRPDKHYTCQVQTDQQYANPKSLGFFFDITSERLADNVHSELEKLDIGHLI